MWFEHSLATEADLARKAAWEKQVADQKQAIAALTAQETERLKSGLAAGATLPKNPEPQFSEQAKADLKRLRVELAAVEKDPPAMPAAMGVTEGEVQDIPVHIRGDFLQLGEMVPRRFPVILAGQAQPRFDKQHSGRLQLAQWLASPEHPLTSRVMANRLWRWHFGQGIVRTPDNFGLLGEKPTHPELLDWLATEFTKNGWSIKQMHRLIMNSAVYQQSSTPIPHSAHTGARMGALRTPHSKDPENRLFSHFSLRRLEAEEIRDSILAVSGSLDRTMGGSILPLKNREYVFDHTSKDNTRYDSKRRSVYVPVVRNNLYDVFSLFDFGDAQLIEGNRPTTTVAPQALFMLNSDMVLDSAAALADQLLQRSELDTDGKDRLLYQKAYSRLPSAKEAARARTLLTRFQQAASEPDPEKRSRQAWTWLTHTTLAANEFIFVR
jgi:hypothetical protein